MYAVRKFHPVFSGPDGQVLANVGRYHRQAVSLAFEMNGGIEWLADWAKNNPDLFFTRLYPRIIPREVEVQASEGVEDMLRRLDAERDAKLVDVTPKETEDA